MKKIILTITCMTMSMFLFSQHGNEGTVSTTESYGEGAGTTGEASSYFGSLAGREDAGHENVFIGYSAGYYNKGRFNVFLGNSAGLINQGDNNVFIGYNAGLDNYSGLDNTYVGFNSGFKNKDGKNNTFLGTYSGRNNISGTENTYIGHSAGVKNQNGTQNTFIGNNAGAHNEKDGNVFIGYNAGLEEYGSDKLYIANSDTDSPLILGDFADKYLSFNGKVGIGHAPGPDSDQLTVNGKILCEEIEVIANVTPDYVFEKYYNGFSDLKADYSMPTLEEVEAFTKANYHLPEIPSADEIQENGMQLKDMTTILLQKVEELTLYTIEQEKRIKALEAKLKTQ